jgi:hypothetical protein
MMLPVLALAAAVAVAALYAYLRRQPDRRTVWRKALLVGCGGGVARAALASLGWYVVEHTGGPLQIPAYALAMLAWPEAALIGGRRVAPAPTDFYLVMSLVLIASTLALAALAAVVVSATRTGAAMPR